MALTVPHYVVEAFDELWQPNPIEFVRKCSAVRAAVFPACGLPVAFDRDGFDGSRDVYHFGALVQSGSRNIIGTIRVRDLKNGQVEFSSLAVLKEYRLSGVGKKVFYTAERYAISRLHACSGIAIVPREPKEGIRRYFELRGFIACQGKSIQKSGIECITMKKEFKNK